MKSLTCSEIKIVLGKLLDRLLKKLSTLALYVHLIFIDLLLAHVHGRRRIMASIGATSDSLGRVVRCREVGTPVGCTSVTRFSRAASTAELLVERALL